METIKEEFEDKENAKCELVIASETSEYAMLETKCKALEHELVSVKEEFMVLKRKNVELEERIALIEKEKAANERVVDLTFKNNDGDDDPTLPLMIENKVLECEKKRAEEVAESWKEKVWELEAQVRRMGSEKALPVLRGEGCALGDENVGSRCMSKNEASEVNGLSKEKVVDLNVDKGLFVSPSRGSSQIPGTPIDTPYKHAWPIKGEEIDGGLKNSSYGSRVRKRLVYKDEGGTIKSMAPSTPAGLRHKTDIISISDSDDEPGETLGIKRALKLESSSNETDEDGPSGCKGECPRSTHSKRKRASNVVTSDSDTNDDDDDKVPIAKLRRKRIQESIHDPAMLQPSGYSTEANNATESVTPHRRRRLVSLSQLEEGNGEEKSPLSNRMICKAKYKTEDDKLEEDESESESEGESLGGFIVDDPSDVNDVSESSDDTKNESDTVSDENMEFGEIISTLKRNRDDKLEWEFEADMLAALGKDDELCLKAVCALYRRQTAEEKSVKGTIDLNGRGFSQIDARRGTTLAEFLLDGEGEIQKSVEELKAYDVKAIEKCRTLANRYSRQLFDIYKSEEDPSFHPS